MFESFPRYRSLPPVYCLWRWWPGGPIVKGGIIPPGVPLLLFPVLPFSTFDGFFKNHRGPL